MYPDAPIESTDFAIVVEAVLAATTTAFEELCQTPVVSREPYLATECPVPDAVSARIILQRAVPGLLTLSFPRPMLEVLTSRYLPDGTSVTSDLADDAAGEFANVIAGQIKTMLKGTPYHFSLTAPEIGMVGGKCNGESNSLTFLFDTDVGGFAVQLRLL